jgi:hypothetical protein
MTQKLQKTPVENSGDLIVGQTFWGIEAALIYTVQFTVIRAFL